MILAKQFPWASVFLVAALTGATTSAQPADPELDATMAQGENDTPLSPQQVQFFETKIRPALVEHCYSCHSNDGSAVRGGLMVDSREGLLGGGQSGPAVVPGDLDGSLLWNAINHLDFEMPPNRKLPEEVLGDFRRWIEMGAPDPRGGPSDPVRSAITAEDIEAGRQFWAYQPPGKAPLPSVADRDWGRGPTDAYLLAAMERAGLSPAGDAPAEVVLRRLHFDLVGLPPSPERLAEFTARHRRSPAEAIADEIDELLQQEAFGERWGRHWLDVVRYAETSGKETELTFPHAWRYRDWVIDSLNDDLPYDEFIQHQIAGDLMPTDDDRQWADQLVATGLLTLGPKSLNDNNPRQFQADLVDDQIDVTTRAILGISVACARCHDHKFDPIPQSDYYAMAGIFQSTETYFGGLASRRVRQSSNLLILPLDDPGTDQPIDLQQLDQWRAELRDKQRELVSNAAEIRQAQRSPVIPIDDPGDDLRRALARRRLLERDIAGLQAAVNQYDAQGQPLTFCMGVQDATQPADMRLLVRGEINQPAQQVRRGIPQVFGATPMIANDESGRLQLAQWMTSRDNPLTARVMVNRVWLHLMGNPLVAETDNFGMSGSPPTHPDLLDALAVEFMESGWSVKSLIREIATSRAYQLSSDVDTETWQSDPENQWYARASGRRLEAEAIRDAMLAAAETLDRQRPRGSAISDLGTTILGPDGIAAPLPGPNRNRPQGRPTPLTEFTSTYRSVYLPVARNAVPRSLDVFDFAEPSMIVGIREESNTATQALYLLNNPFVLQQSEAFARRVMEESSSPREAVERAFQIAFSRSPTADELRSSLRFLSQVQSDLQQEIAASAPTVARLPAARPGLAGGRLARSRLARQMAARNASPASRNASPPPPGPLVQLCHALFASAEFRYLP